MNAEGAGQKHVLKLLWTTITDNILDFLLSLYFLFPYADARILRAMHFLTLIFLWSFSDIWSPNEDSEIFLSLILKTGFQCSSSFWCTHLALLEEEVPILAHNSSMYLEICSILSLRGPLTFEHTSFLKLEISLYNIQEKPHYWTITVSVHETEISLFCSGF